MRGLITLTIGIGIGAALVLYNPDAAGWFEEQFQHLKNAVS